MTKKRIWPENRLQELRDKAGLTRSELAAKIGVFYTAIQKWEEGERKFTVERRKELAAILGVDWTEFEAGGAPVESAPINEADLADLLERMLAAAREDNIGARDLPRYLARAVHIAIGQRAAGAASVPARKPARSATKAARA